MHYLIMEDFSGTPAVFIFPERVDHADMRGQLPYAKVISCGSVTANQKGFVCSGGNRELGIQAAPEDAAIICQAFESEGQSVT